MTFCPPRVRSAQELTGRPVHSFGRISAVTCRALSLLALGLVLVAGAVWNPAAARNDGEVTTAAPTRSLPRVRTAPVEPSPSHRTIDLHGLTRAADRAQLGFTQPGRLARRPATEGDRVERGDALAVLDDAPLRAQLAAAEAQVTGLEVRLDQLQVELDRAERLVEQDALPSQKRDEARSSADALTASLSAARAGRDEAARQVREATLRAPFDGLVMATLASPGEVVGAGTPVLILQGQGGEVVVEVPQALYSSIEPGAPARVRLVALDRELAGTVRSVGRSPAGPGRLFAVVVALEQQVDPGLSAVVELQIPLEPGLAVPLRAIADPTGGRPVVWTVRDGVAREVGVQTGALVDRLVSVDGDLDLGDAVVVAGLVALADGAEVEVVR